MATIKAGTYRFNDVFTTPAPNEQQINFVINPIFGDIVYTAQCSAMLNYGAHGYPLCYYCVSAEPEFPSEFDINLPYAVPVVLYDSTSTDNSHWNNMFDVESLKIITIAEDTEVSAEFYEWFTANAVQQKQLSGVWKFNDVLTKPAFDMDEQINFEIPSYLGATVSTTPCTGFHNKSRPTQEEWAWLLQYYGTLPVYTADYEQGKMVWSHHEAIANGESVYNDAQSIDFGTTPQTVSEDFYNWFTANAKRLSTITYNGLTIATLNGGQTATLKCKGMKMATDVVVEVAENVGGGGECKHEVYDLSVSNIRSVLLKSKIERPTAEQINLFDNGVGIAYVPFDVEGLEHITDVEYQTVVISEGVSISMVYLRAAGQGVMAYYVWEEDIPIMKAIMPSMGLDVSAVTGEGWQFVTENKARTLSNEDLKELNLYRTYYYLIPCGDYLDSLFTFHISEGEPVDVVTIDDRKVLLTKDTLCQQDIWAKKIGYQGVYVCDEDHMGSIAGFNDEKEYDDLTYIDVTFVANGVDDYLMVGGRGQDLSGVTKPSFSASLSPNETRMVKVRRNSTKGITVETHSEIIRTVYTNATIVSQSDDKVYISGLRHDTHIVVVAE